MSPKRTSARPKLTKVEPNPGSEWIGGRLSPPFFVTGDAQPYRVTLVVWMEQPSGLIVGQLVCTPNEVEGALGRALQSALAQPVDSGSRRPHRLRVNDDALAAEVRAVIPDSIPIEVAPTPELDALLDLMVKTMPRSPQKDVSYLEGGRISPASVADLFHNAGILYRIAPWKVVRNDLVLRLDIPKLDVNGACLIIIGRLGQSLGLLVFPSLARYRTFLEAAEQRPKKGVRPHAGTDWLALSFERGAYLSTTQRREVDAHRWPVVDAHAYPVLTHRDPDGSPRPLVERDLQIATATARSLSVFFVKYRSLFESTAFEPVSESFTDRSGLDVRFTIPYEAFELFE